MNREKTNKKPAIHAGLWPQNRANVVLRFPGQAALPEGCAAAIEGGLHRSRPAVIGGQRHGVVPSVGSDIGSHEVGRGLERSHRVPGTDAQTCGGVGLELRNALGARR